MHSFAESHLSGFTEAQQEKVDHMILQSCLIQVEVAELIAYLELGTYLLVKDSPKRWGKEVHLAL